MYDRCTDSDKDVVQPNIDQTDGNNEEDGYESDPLAGIIENDDDYGNDAETEDVTPEFEFEYQRESIEALLLLNQTEGDSIQIESTSVESGQDGTDDLGDYSEILHVPSIDLCEKPPPKKKRKTVTITGNFLVTDQ